MPVDEFESLFGDAAAGGSVQGGGEHARSDAVAELGVGMFAMYRQAMRIDSRPDGLALSLPRFRCRPPPGGTGSTPVFSRSPYRQPGQLEQLEQSSRLVPGGSNMAS